MSSGTDALPEPYGSAVEISRLHAFTILAFRAICGPIFRAWFRIRVENSPALTGPYVVVANHTSFLDPLMLGSGAPRHINFLMTSTVWRGHTLRWFYRWMRALPLSTLGGNRDALRAARTMLGKGEVLGVFPEGGISRDGQLMLGSPGAVSLVLGEAVPVVPCGIVGAHAMLPFGSSKLRRSGIVLRFGAPISPEALVAGAGPSRKERLAVATRRIMRELATLVQQPAREDVLEVLARRRPVS